MVSYRFGNHVLDTEKFTLMDGEVTVSIEPQVFALLQFLLENRERVVTKDELFEHVWEGRIVSDGTLTSRINSIRRALGDDGKTQAIIKTFPRRGFRFVALLEGVQSGDPKPIQETDIGHSQPSVAVVPFDNLSGDEEQKYFSDGITKDIISALSQVRQFNVVAGISTSIDENRVSDAKEIARILNVRYILDGSVRKAGSKVRVTAHLIDGETGNHIWSEKFDRKLEDVFAVQDEITQSVVGALGPALNRAERDKARLKPPENLSAWELSMRGHSFLYRRTDENLAEAEKYLNQAIKLDENSVSAYYGLTWVNFLRVWYGKTREVEQSMEQARVFARRAIEAELGNFASHEAMSLATLVNGDLDASIRESEVALEHNPASMQSHHQIGRVLTFSGAAKDAIPHLEMAIQLGRRELYGGGCGYAGMSEAYLSLEEYESAVDWGRRALTEFPDTSLTAGTALSAALSHLGRTKEAKSVAAEILAVHPDFTVSRFHALKVITDKALVEKFTDGLRKAGFPNS